MLGKRAHLLHQLALLGMSLVQGLGNLVGELRQGVGDCMYICGVCRQLEDGSFVLARRRRFLGAGSSAFAGRGSVRGAGLRGGRAVPGAGAWFEPTEVLGERFPKDRLP